MSSEKADEDILERISELCSDRISGSTTLFRKALKVAEKIVKDENANRRELLGKLAGELSKNFPDMVILTRFSEFLTDAADVREYPDYNEILNYMMTSEDEINAIPIAISRHLSKLIKKGSRIITLSRSETVLEVVTYLYAEGFVDSVIISESGPANEGVIMAKSLTERGIMVELVADEALDSMCSESDFALIGADTVYIDFSVLNKIGSRSLALSCQKRNKNFYVVAGESKLIKKVNSSLHGKIQENREVYDATGADNTDRNNYFEVIESSLITWIITENGPKGKSAGIPK